MWPSPGTLPHQWGEADGSSPHTAPQCRGQARRHWVAHLGHAQVPVLLRGRAPQQPLPPPGGPAVGGTRRIGWGTRSDTRHTNPGLVPPGGCLLPGELKPQHRLGPRGPGPGRWAPGGAPQGPRGRLRGPAVGPSHGHQCPRGPGTRPQPRNRGDRAGGPLPRRARSHACPGPLRGPAVARMRRRSRLVRLSVATRCCEGGLIWAAASPCRTSGAAALPSGLTRPSPREGGAYCAVGRAGGGGGSLVRGRRCHRPRWPSAPEKAPVPVHVALVVACSWHRL